MGRRELLRIDAKVEVVFKRFDQFYTEYTKNISKGGMFLNTDRVFKPQTVLQINLKLPDLDEPMDLVGEVVHVVDKDTADAHKLDPGMGIQFVDFEEGFHQALERYIAESIKKGPEQKVLDRRAHKRISARLKVRFPSMDVLRKDYSRDISKGGIFIQTNKPREIGDRFALTLVHPESGQELELVGEVVRISKLDPKLPGSLSGMGIRFAELDDEKRADIRRFLELDL